MRDRSIWLVGALVVVLAIVAGAFAIAYSNALATQESAEAKTKATQGQLAAVQANLSSCATAYRTSSEVSGELRSEMSDALDQLGDYAASLGTTPLNSDAIAARISATNDKEAGIDATGCEAAK